MRRHRRDPAGLLAFRDVRDAFRQYLKSRRRPPIRAHRPQPGQPDAAQLIAEEIEKNPALRKRMLLAILPGYNLLVRAADWSAAP